MIARQIKAAYEELSKHASPWARVRTIECSPEDTAAMLGAMAENAATGDRGLCGVAIRQSSVLPPGSLAFLDWRGRRVGAMSNVGVLWEPDGPRATFVQSDQPSPTDEPGGAKSLTEGEVDAAVMRDLAEMVKLIEGAGEARSFTEDQVEYLITRGRR